MNTPNRSNIKIGSRVAIVLKADQSSGKLTEGIVQAILTNSSSHPTALRCGLKAGRWGGLSRFWIETPA